VPQSGESTGHKDSYLLPRIGAEEACNTLLTVVAERLPALGFSSHHDVQVLAPTRKGPLGTDALNELLQERLNADGQPIQRGARKFRLGDRVICTRNRYDLDVFNGDVGRITRQLTQGIQVDFQDRTIAWPWEDLGVLELAYAITVHKSQGSEYPCVVLALHQSHSIMLKRNLFYTAITRARSFLCVVGDHGAWSRAAATQGGDERYTLLRQRLSKADEKVD